MMRKRIFTYKFVFKWNDGTEDETEFCASNIDKAMELAQENGSEECEYEYDSIREA